MSKKKENKTNLIKKLDTLFSQYIRQSKSDSFGNTTCITCGKIENWKNQDCGHFMSRTNMSTRWDERNVDTQCRYCNRYCQGKQFEFSLKIGKELSEELYLLSKQTKKWSLDEIKDMIEQYKDKLKEFS
jgi:hypothetical protein